MLLKNFGVSRHGRVVFYDYDELRLVTDCRFRDWPQATTYEEQMADAPWFHVDAGDVFPERFPQFLGLPEMQAKALKAAHGDLFLPAWWRDLQSHLAAGDYPDTPPYPDTLRLA
jgi:isocitrate dehydrogenase kinase/phosphatase